MICLCTLYVQPRAPWVNVSYLHVQSYIEYKYILIVWPFLLDQQMDCGRDHKANDMSDVQNVYPNRWNGNAKKWNRMAWGYGDQEKDLQCHINIDYEMGWRTKIGRLNVGISSCFNSIGPSLMSRYSPLITPISIHSYLLNVQWSTSFTKVFHWHHHMCGLHVNIIIVIVFITIRFRLLNRLYYSFVQRIIGFFLIFNIDLLFWRKRRRQKKMIFLMRLWQASKISIVNIIVYS